MFNYQILRSLVETMLFSLIVMTCHRIKSISLRRTIENIKQKPDI